MTDKPRRSEPSPEARELLARHDRLDLAEMVVALHKLEADARAELGRLRAGEEPATDPAVEPTPAQWLWQYNRATPEDRLRVIEALLRDSAKGRNCFFMAHEKRLGAGREAEATIARVRQVWDTWRLMTLEPGQVRRLLDEVGRALDVPRSKETAPVPVEPDPAVAQEAVRQMDADPHGLKAGMTVQPYREYGQEKWVFRCWGTDDGCEGLLSLDHTSRQGAERARDRHVAEEHAAQPKEQPRV